MRRRRCARLGLAGLVVSVALAATTASVATAAARSAARPPAPSAARPAAAPAAPPAPPWSVTVTPATDLAPTAIVALHAEGFLADAFVDLFLCDAGTPVAWGACAPVVIPTPGGTGGSLGRTTPAGTLDEQVRLHRRSWTATAALVDCSDAPGCVVAVRDRFNPLVVAAAPVTFDADAPGPTATVALAAPGPFLDFERVPVEASGFIPDATVEGSRARLPNLCVAGTVVCRPLAYSSLPTPGVWRPEVTLRRSVPVPGGEPVDCATVAGGCELVFRHNVDAERLATAPVAFDTGVPFLARPVLLTSVLLREGDGPGGDPALLSIVVPDRTVVTSAVSYDTRRGTARGHAVDYKRRVATARINPGSLFEPITVPVMHDDEVEGPEWFTVELTGASGLDPAPWAGMVVIDDDDLPTGPPAVVAGGTLALEGDVARVPLRLSAPSADPVTVAVRTERGTASAGSGDYSRRRGEVTFAPGVTEVLVDVAIAADGTPEGPEWLRLVVAPVQGAPVAQPYGLVGIADSASAPAQYAVLSRGVGFVAVGSG